MIMSREQLQASIQHLHEQLAALGKVDPEVRQHLLQTLAEIEQSLDESEAGSRDSLIDRLRESAERFEGSHPTFTSLLGNMCDALAQMGI